MTELAKPFEMTLPAVTKHLKVLQRAGLITQGRQAQWRPCRLDAKPATGGCRLGGGVPPVLGGAPRSPGGLPPRTTKHRRRNMAAETSKTVTASTVAPTSSLSRAG